MRLSDHTRLSSSIDRFTRADKLIREVAKAWSGVDNHCVSLCEDLIMRLELTRLQIETRAKARATEREAAR